MSTAAPKLDYRVRIHFPKVFDAIAADTLATQLDDKLAITTE
ncbi:MAG: hypothetical protein O3C63_01205 [Cyanobacteria bacterium]|nr:hypothetical protein [Cyanobacteriota bacterium]MDA1021102.1 hypothetical protein [Cyanobacteriota bacterium]